MLIFVEPIVDFLGRFFFTFNFNDTSLSMYYVSFFFHVFYVFLSNIVCIVHFEAWSLSVERIKCFHVCVSVHYPMFTVGLWGVLCALWLFHRSWKLENRDSNIGFQVSSFIMFIISFPKSSICGSTITFVVNFLIRILGVNGFLSHSLEAWSLCFFTLLQIVIIENPELRCLVPNPCVT
jgi:hypothetical protein